MKDSIASHYKGRSGEKYSRGRRQDVLNHLGYELQAKYFLPYLSIDSNVLDFGCGNGSLAKAIEPHVAQIHGLEVNNYPREIAQTHQNLKVYSRIGEIPADRLYDVIVSNHVLEHIPNVVDTLKLLRKHLVPGGKFVTVLPIDDFRDPANSKWSSENLDHHLHTWTPLLFGNTLIEAGFQPIQTRIITHAWTGKLFFLGDGWLQDIACYFVAVLKKRRQLLAVATTARDKYV